MTTAVTDRQPCDGLCCPDEARCFGRELIAAEIRAMQAAIAPGPLTEPEALAALQAAAPHLGANYNRMRAVRAAFEVLYVGVHSPGARVMCLKETDRMLQAVFAVRRTFFDAHTARITALLAPMLQER